MKYYSRAILRLTVGEKHIKDWSDEKEALLRTRIESELDLEKDNIVLKFFVKSSQKRNVEITASFLNESADELRVIRQIENLFFDLEIYERQFIYEKKG